MPQLKLTDAAVARIKPPEKGQAEFFDALLPSFGLRVSYSGTKAWFVMTRVDRKLIRMTLGRYPMLSLADARAKAREVIQCAASGVDPRRVEQDLRRKMDDEARTTFGMVAEQFMTKHVRSNLRPATAREYQRILFGQDTEAWRARPIASIEKRDVMAVIEAIEARGAESASIRSLAYLRKFFGWCADRDLIATPPTDRVRRPRAVQARERVLSQRELQLALRAFDEEGGAFGRLFRFVALTGQRRGEVAGMRWEELRDLKGEAPIWEMPGARTKNRRVHFVPLVPAAIRIIEAAPRTGQFVFTATGDRPVSGFSKSKTRIDQRVANIAASVGQPQPAHWTLHDLRRTMVTVMNEDLGIAPHVVEAVVNHVTGSAKTGVAGVYNRALYLTERWQALMAWAAYLEATEGLEAPDKIRMAQEH